MKETKRPQSKQSTQPEGKDAKADARGGLLQAAKRIFACKGYEGTTVKDLADEAGVNVSLVSYHFGGKENLFRTCLENFGMERVEATERIMKAPASIEELKLRLRLYAEELVEIHLREPDTCKIIHTAMDLSNPFAAELFKNVFVRVFLSLRTFLSSAQTSGFIRPNIETDIVATLMFGSLIHMLKVQEFARLMEEPTIDQPEYKERVLSQWLELVTNGVLPFAPDPKQPQTPMNQTEF